MEEGRYHVIIEKADFQVNGGNFKWMDGMWVTAMKVIRLFTWEFCSQLISFKYTIICKSTGK